MDKEEFVKVLTDRIIDHEARPLSTMLMFWNNKNELDALHDGTKDKRYHSRANAQAGQIFDADTAQNISIGREYWDLLRKNTWDKKPNTTFLDVLKDGLKDLQADFYGLGQGLLNPFSNVDNILDYKYLDNLND